MGKIIVIDGRACGQQSHRGCLVVRVPASLGRCVHHQLMRAVVPVIRGATSESAFDALIASSRGALSIVFAGFDPDLSEDQQQIAQRFSARLGSHLTHNVPLQELLWREYSRFLIAANGAIPFVIVVDDLCQLDASSFAIMMQMFRVCAARAPDVIVGVPSDLPEQIALDDRGIAWDLGAPELRRMLGVLRRVPGYTAGGRGQTEPCCCPIVRDPRDPCLEQRVRQVIERLTHEPSAAEVASIAPAVRRIFASFAFDTALRLALDVLDAAAPLSPDDRASICGIAAVAAHNRQFFSRGNQRIARFLRDTYREALAYERDLDHRLALYYRLAVTHCRRLGDTQRAREAIDAGLAELAHPQLPALERQLQEAWLRNIDAFVRVRDGDLAAAFTCCERAFAALREPAPSADIPDAEVELSKLVICENALTLASMTGNEPLRERWLARATHSFGRWPSLAVVELLEQQRTHIDRLELAKARQLAIDALDVARPQHNPLLEHFLLVNLSDLSFRMSDHHAAAEYSAAARSIADELGDIEQTRLALELRAAEIAEALEQLDGAEQILHGLLDAGTPSLDLRVDGQGRLARLYARRGQRERALELIEQVIDLAADSGELDLLLRASCHAGDVASLLGMSDDARAAYASCLELLETAPASTQDRELLRLAVVVGGCRVGSPDPAQLARCLRRLPGLMARAHDAWPLARALVTLPLTGLLDADLEATLRVVSTALAGADARLPRDQSSPVAAHD